ncbi:17353_t:CDS:2, partial [Racocetra persica]
VDDSDEEANFQELYNKDSKEFYEMDDDTINLSNNINFAKDEYESIISSLDSLVKCIDRSTFQEQEVAITIARREYSSDKTVKQNLSCQAKYQQGLGYTKKAVNLALETGCESAPKKHIRNVLENHTSKRQNQKADEPIQRIYIFISSSYRINKSNCRNYKQFEETIRHSRQQNNVGESSQHSNNL